MTIVECKNVYKNYQMGKVIVPALKGINCTFESGFSLIIGASGSGKSSLLNLIGGLDDLSEGELFVGGVAINQLSSKALTDYRRRHIGFIFQSFSLIQSLNVSDNIAYPLFGDHQITPAERKKRVSEVLEGVGLPGYEKRFPQEMSGGQQQRVAIARALVCRPKLLIADEPTASLDSQTSDNIFSLLEHMAENFHTSVIIASHDHQVISKFSRVLKLQDGQIVEEMNK